MTPGPKTWRIPPIRTSTGDLHGQLGITPLQARLLANRGITGIETTQDFLNPRLMSMADPMEMADMEEAVSTVAGAIADGRKITVYGDYDADGLTSTAILVHFLSRLPVPVGWYIPNRLTEGYGLNGQALTNIAKNGTSLLITADCGTSSVAEIALARGMGMDVVVTDHHRVSESPRPSCPFVNPNRWDCRFPFKDLAGVGVAFYLLVALRSALRSAGFFKDHEEPDLREFLDLVALGTVADAVPLTGENRTFVKFGLDRMSKSSWWGLEALKTVCGFGKQTVSSEDVAFKLAPRLNAAGRIGDSTSGMKLLLSREPLETMRWARALESANKKRKIEEQRILASAEKSASSSAAEKRTLFMAAKGWHRGVLGIAASRLAGRYNRPTLLLSVTGDIAYGSARSIPGFDLHNALGLVGHMLNGFGGHAMAAGFSVKTDRIKALEEAFEAIAAENIPEDPPAPELSIDAELRLEQVDESLIADLAKLAPYGQGNPEPCFIAHRLKAIGPRVIGDGHLKMEMVDGNRTMEAIGFGMAERKPVDGELMDVLFTPEVNTWQGVSQIQLRITDMRYSAP
jgi:single-stranded-DNA-specific exonuclease